MDKRPNPNHDPLIPDLIHAATGERPISLTPIATYLATIVYQAQLPSQTVIFKATDPQGPNDPDGIGLEAWACEAVQALGVPAPRILAVNTSQSRLPASYLIMEKAAGQPLSTLTKEHRQSFLPRLGAYWRQIHSIPVAGFGWLDEQQYRQHQTVQGTFATWPDALLHDIPASLAYFQNLNALNPAELETCQHVIEAVQPIAQQLTSGRLLNGDLGSLHVWVDPAADQITSIIDFGDRASGDPIWDIMRYEWEDLDQLMTGYDPELAKEPRFKKTFHLYAVLQALPWAHKHHARGAQHTINWLKITLDRVLPYLKD